MAVTFIHVGGVLTINQMPQARNGKRAPHSMSCIVLPAAVKYSGSKSNVPKRLLSHVKIRRIDGAIVRFYDGRGKYILAAKSPALSQRTREGQGTHFLCVLKAWASPPECLPLHPEDHAATKLTGVVVAAFLGRAVEVAGLVRDHARIGIGTLRGFVVAVA